MGKQNDQIVIINSLRGIAATAVCFYHFVYTTQNFVDHALIREIFHFGQKGVQLFFIISGIVIPLSMIRSNYTLKSWGHFLTKRFIRIEPPYIVAVAIAVGYLILRNFIPSTNQVDLTPSFTDILLHLGYLIPFFEDVNWVNPVFWTLAIEFQYYLALSVLFPLLLSKKWGLRALFYALFIGAGFLGVADGLFPYWAPYFLAGIIYILWFKKIIPQIEFIIVAAIIAPVIYYINGGVDLGIAVFGLLAIHYLPQLKSKITLFLGKISYSLYLLHSIIGAAFINYLSHYFTAWYLKVVLVIVGFLISVFSAYILYRVVEKPTHNYAKKLRQKA